MQVLWATIDWNSVSAIASSVSAMIAGISAYFSFLVIRLTFATLKQQLAANRAYLGLKSFEGINMRSESPELKFVVHNYGLRQASKISVDISYYSLNGLLIDSDRFELSSGIPPEQAFTVLFEPPSNPDINWEIIDVSIRYDDRPLKESFQENVWIKVDPVVPTGLLMATNLEVSKVSEAAQNQLRA